MTTGTVHFDGVTDLEESRVAGAGGLDDATDGANTNNDNRRARVVFQQDESARSLMSAPAVPPEQHRRTSIQITPEESAAMARLSVDDVLAEDGEYHDALDADHFGGIHTARHSAPGSTARRHRFTMTFGGVSKRTAYREIRRQRKTLIKQRRGWDNYKPNSSSSRTLGDRTTISTQSGGNYGAIEEVDEDGRLMSSVTAGDGLGGPGDADRLMSSMSVATPDLHKQHREALIEMFMENKINVLLAFLPLAWWSHHFNWSGGSVFILNFLAMVPLASMLGVFTEELAAHTNDVIGGLINATFGNAVELVVAIQALLANDFRVVQASLIGSVFSNILLVLGMCFFCGGMRYPEQEFIAQGAVASIALLAFSGLTLLMPMFLGEEDDAAEGSIEVELTLSRVGAMLLVLMYGQLLFFQLKTHVHLFEGDGGDVALIPFSWALTGLVVITAMVTLLSEWLVGSIDGFCEEFKLGRSFVGVIILPVVGNAVEHISAVSVAMKNKMDLALGVALGSAVQIALFVLPMVVVIGWMTGREMSLKFPAFEVYLYLLSVIMVSLCLTNQRSNWLEGSLLVFTYAMIAVGIYFEKDDIANS